MNEKDIQARIAEGKAWDAWQKWVNCNTPIKTKYDTKLKLFHDEAFWKEVGLGIAVGTGMGSESWGPDTNIGTGGGPGKNTMSGNRTVRGWLSVLGVIGLISWERSTAKKIVSDYYSEVAKECGPKPPHP